MKTGGASTGGGICVLHNPGVGVIHDGPERTPEPLLRAGLDGLDVEDTILLEAKAAIAATLQEVEGTEQAPVQLRGPASRDPEHGPQA